jgi:hypothetical protein
VPPSSSKAGELLPGPEDRGTNVWFWDRHVPFEKYLLHGVKSKRMSVSRKKRTSPRHPPDGFRTMGTSGPITPRAIEARLKGGRYYRYLNEDLRGTNGTDGKSKTRSRSRDRSKEAISGSSRRPRSGSPGPSRRSPSLSRSRQTPTGLTGPTVPTVPTVPKNIAVLEKEGTFQLVFTKNKDNPVKSITFTYDEGTVYLWSRKLIGSGAYGIIREFEDADGFLYAVKIIEGGIHRWWTERTATRMLRDGDVNCGQVRAREVISPDNPADVAARRAVQALPRELRTVEFVAQCAAISAVAAIPMPLTVNLAISFALNAANKAVSTMFPSALSVIVKSNIKRAVTAYVDARQNKEGTEAAIQNAANETAFTEQDVLDYYSSFRIGHAVSKEKPDTPYISIMPRLHGNLHDLKTLLQTSGSMDIPQAVRITESVRQQVSCLIRKNKMFVYTDMKPANIMYTMDAKNKIKIYMGDLGSLVPDLNEEYLLTYPCILTSTEKADESSGFMKLPTTNKREECLAYELGILFCLMLPLDDRYLDGLLHSNKHGHAGRINAMEQILEKLKKLGSRKIDQIGETNGPWNNAVSLLYPASTRHSIHESLYGTGEIPELLG